VRGVLIPCALSFLPPNVRSEKHFGLWYDDGCGRYLGLFGGRCELCQRFPISHLGANQHALNCFYQFLFYRADFYLQLVRSQRYSLLVYSIYSGSAASYRWYKYTFIYNWGFCPTGIHYS